MMTRTGILLNNPFGFKLEREPVSMTHCFELALGVIKKNYPTCIIETRSLDQLLLQKRFDKQHYWQYPFVMTGYEGAEKMRRDIFVYFFVVWCKKKQSPKAFPFDAYYRAFEKIQQTHTTAQLTSSLFPHFCS